MTGFNMPPGVSPRDIPGNEPEQRERVKRASYRDAIDWIARNDDCEWINDEHGSFSVTVALVADIFGVSTDKATADLRRAHKKAWGNK